MFYHDAPGTSNHFETAPLRLNYTLFTSFRQFQFDVVCTVEQILKAGAFSCILPAFRLKQYHPLVR